MKADRHATVEAICQWCGIVFPARRERVEKGQSRFCSREHHREWVKSQGSQRKNIGKENAIIQWDDKKNMYVAYWYEPDTMKYKSSGWARWAWELKFGEVPKGYRATYKDGNSKNNKIRNVCLKTMAEISTIGERTRGVPKSKKTRKLLSIAHTGKTLTEEHKKNISISNAKKWAEGLFDKVHKGENNWRWRGGVEKPYPKEFEDIKEYIRTRDDYTCQICSKHLHKRRDCQVHHKNGNKKHNDENNLILLCTACHGKIHAKAPASPVIMAFRSLLEWNQEEVL